MFNAINRSNQRGSRCALNLFDLLRQAHVRAFFGVIQSKASVLGKTDFVQMYNFMWSTFRLAGEAGMVIHPCYWDEDTEPKLGVETIKLLRGEEYVDILNLDYVEKRSGERDATLADSTAIADFFASTVTGTDRNWFCSELT